MHRIKFSSVSQQFTCVFERRASPFIPFHSLCLYTFVVVVVVVVVLTRVLLYINGCEGGICRGVALSEHAHQWDTNRRESAGRAREGTAVAAGERERGEMASGEQALTRGDTVKDEEVGEEGGRQRRANTARPLHAPWLPKRGGPHAGSQRRGVDPRQTGVVGSSRDLIEVDVDEHATKIGNSTRGAATLFFGFFCISVYNNCQKLIHPLHRSMFVDHL